MMKKTILFVSICFLLVAGYLVGQLQKQDSGSKTPAENSIFEQPKQSRYLDKLSASDSSSGSDAYGFDGESGCSLSECTEDVVELPAPDLSTDPAVGNPKGSKIIKSGSVEITIDRGTVTEKFDDVVKLIPQGGYIEASESTRRTSTLTVRIPSEKLDETLVALRKLGTITRESIGSVDRTYDAIDYDARLKIMREREIVLVELLKKATNASETANIQSQIFQLRGDIESTLGLKSVLEEQVALSTLTISISEDGVKKEEVEEKSILSKAWTTSVGAMLTSLSGILIVFTSIFPLLIVAGIGIFLTQKARSRKRSVKNEE